MMELPFLEGREKRFWFRSRKRSEFSVEGPLTPKKVKEISRFKGEPGWMTRFRLKGFEFFRGISLPDFGPDLSGIDFENMIYYSKPADKARSWDEVPRDIRRTFEKLGMSEAEMRLLSGVELQYDSEIVFERARKELEKLGVIYMSMDDAVKEHPGIVRRYLGKLVRPDNNKFSALNTAVWSGGTFIYVPPGVRVPFPLHTYFRINLEGFGQFERTLIVVGEGSEVTYVEGCTAPLYSRATLHASVVEAVALPDSRLKYVTLQNWSKNVYNLVTMKALAQRGAFVQGISGNFGSKVTMRYPSIYLAGERARGESMSVTISSKGQEMDLGARIVHSAPETSSRTVSKTISLDGGVSTFRGLLRILRGSGFSRAGISCDSLLSGDSRANSVPVIDVKEKTAELSHEAKVGEIDMDKLFYLMSRGVSESKAMGMLIFGFVRDFVEELPLEYALELQKLIEMDMGGGV